MQIENRTTTDAVQTFDFNGLTLRALLVEGEPWFIALDVANALEYNDAWNMTRRLDPDEIQNLQIGGFGNRGVNIINESGLYEAIFNSRKPEAKAFKHWVKNDVLPAIRKTGAYEKPKTEAEKVFEVFELLRAQAEESRRELEVARPKAEVYDKILTPEHTFGFRDLCKTLREHFPINEADVKRVLREKKILTPGFRLDVYSAAIDKGYAVRHPSGKWGGKERFQPRFTTKTLEWLLAELAPLEEVA